MAEQQQEPPALLPHEEPLPPRVDLWIAMVFFALGAAIIAISLQMPTYREQLGEIYTAPGLVPTVHGAIVILLSLWLGQRSIARGAMRRGASIPTPKREGYSNARLAIAAALCLVFTTGLIGRMPFWLAAAIFVSGFITLFEWRGNLSRAERMKRLAIALAIGAATGAAVVLVFERLFLVRLP